MISEIEGLEFDHVKLQQICEEYGVEKLLIFGSFAKGSQTQKSDVDILYRFKDGIKIGMEIVSFAEALEELFGREVDIVPEKFADLKRHGNMLSEAVRFYDAA